MKALISALALLSFVAASTIPVAAPAQAATTHKVVHKKAKKKHVAKAKKTHKSVSKKKKPVTPKAG
jgi:Ni/Co efflux regulator RcnB